MNLASYNTIFSDVELGKLFKYKGRFFIRTDGDNTAVSIDTGEEEHFESRCIILYHSKSKLIVMEWEVKDEKVSKEMTWEEMENE